MDDSSYGIHGALETQIRNKLNQVPGSPKAIK